MSEVKHIPGPYKYDPDNDRDDLQIRDAIGGLIASVEDNRVYTLGQCQATAKLFSAAPELFEALRLALPYIEGAYECAFPDSDHNENVLEAAKAAIAKATS